MTISMEGAEASGSSSTTRRLTLADQMSAVDSSNIRQLLTHPTLSLNDLLLTDKFPSSRGPTLLDIIQNEETKQREAAAGCKELIGHRDKITWKTFRDKLKLKRASDIIAQNSRRSHSPRPNSFRFDSIFSWVVDSAESTQNTGNEALHSNQNGGNGVSSPNSVRLDSLLAVNSDESTQNVTRPVEPVRSSDDPAVQPVDSVRPVDGENEGSQVGSVRLSTILAEERQLSAREAAVVEEEDQPPRMSLMDLLEETEPGFSGSIYRMVDEDMDDEEDDGDEQEDVRGSSSSIEHTCCVCMVRHKGAAFIPCGHTFCRLCSREVWVQRGNCPLCNNFIVEVLDIF